MRGGDDDLIVQQQTTDGQRLYPGDEYKGVRLTAIDGNRITFTGREPIEVRW